MKNSIFGRLLGGGDPHHEAEQLIQKSLDGQLTSRERVRLDAHVASCEACAATWDEYRKLSRSASQWVSAGTTDPGDEFTQRIMAQIGTSDERSAPVRTRVGGHAWIAGAAAALVVFAVAAWFLPPFGDLLRTAGQLHWGTDAPQALSSLHFRGMGIGLPSANDASGLLPTLASWWRALETSVSTVGASGLSNWPLYVFLVALVGNIALAGSMARHRRRAL